LLLLLLLLQRVVLLLFLPYISPPLKTWHICIRVWYICKQCCRCPLMYEAFDWIDRVPPQSYTHTHTHINVVCLWSTVNAECCLCCCRSCCRCVACFRFSTEIKKFSIFRGISVTLNSKRFVCLAEGQGDFSAAYATRKLLCLHTQPHTTVDVCVYVLALALALENFCGFLVVLGQWQTEINVFASCQ